jgi:3' exoribonuclease, RNase T-like
MAKHLMVDMETMAVSPSATVLSLGAVHFNPYGNGYGDKIYFRINIDDQDALGREVDPSTLDWWAKQDPKIMEEAFSPDDRKQWTVSTSLLGGAMHFGHTVLHLTWLFWKTFIANSTSHCLGIIGNYEIHELFSI